MPMLSYDLPLRPQEMTVPQLDKFREYMLNKMTPEQEEKFYNELAEDKRSRNGKRKNEESTPLLDEEEMEIMKKSKVFEEDEPRTPLEEKEKDMDLFKDANIDADYEDFLKELDYEGEGGKRRTRKGGRRLRRKTKKHHKKSKTHKKRKMHKKRRTHRKR